MAWNGINGEVTTKMAYDSLLFDKSFGQKKWWYYGFWKWHLPLKVKLFCWLMLENKFLTRYNYLKRGGNWPNICILCYMVAKSIDQLMVHY